MSIRATTPLTSAFIGETLVTLKLAHLVNFALAPTVQKGLLTLK